MENINKSNIQHANKTIQSNSDINIKKSLHDQLGICHAINIYEICYHRKIILSI